MSQPKQPEVGPLGRNLLANADRIRQDRRLSWREVSARLQALGRPIPPLGLARMMQAGRRVDVDEASALAEVLGVTLAELLASPDAGPAPDHLALRAAANLSDRIRQLLDAGGDTALPARQVSRAFRRVEVEIEELLEEAPGAGKEIM